MQEISPGRPVDSLVVLTERLNLHPFPVRVAYGLIPGGTTVRFVDFAWISVAGALTALFCLDAIGGARRGARGAS